MSVIGNNVGIGKIFGASAPAFAAETGLTEKPKGNQVSAKEEFMSMMDKSPAERMRESILRQLGITEDDIKNMTPEELEKLQKKIEDMIKEKVQQAMEQQKGKDMPGGVLASFMA